MRFQKKAVTEDSMTDHTLHTLCDPANTRYYLYVTRGGKISRKGQNWSMEMLKNNNVLLRGYLGVRNALFQYPWKQPISKVMCLESPYALR